MLAIRNAHSLTPKGPEAGGAGAQPGTASAWYALYTRARHEKKVQVRLRTRGFETYLPLVPRQRRWHDRRVTVDWPMFSSYVFVRCPRAALSEVLATPGVLTVVRQNGEPASIRDKVIEDVRRLTDVAVDTGSLPEPTAFVVPPGGFVEVISGPLAGVEGVVVEDRGNGRVLFEIGVEAIGQGLKVELDASRLRVCEEAV